VLLALAAELDLDIDHLTTIFLNGDLEEEVYMWLARGFIKEREEQKVCMSTQEGSVWAETIIKCMEQENSLSTT
jgi:hypothetical protein